MSKTIKKNDDCYKTEEGADAQIMPDVLYTVREVAQMLKTNVDYVHKLRRSGLLPFLKIGQYKVRTRSLENFLERCEGLDLTDPFNVKELN